MKTYQRVAVAGIGGYAMEHHRALYDLEKNGQVKVIAACDPRHDRLGALKERFQFSSRGVSVFSDFHKMLSAEAFDWISLATPIDTHSTLHALCVEKGVPCYLEKPPTLDPSELEAMIATDSRAIKQTQVGFNHLYEPERLAVKRRLLRGEFGALKRICVRGAWMRPQGYYQRSRWAGQLMLDNKLILDSCLGNAMAHNVIDALFFAGTRGLADWGVCSQVKAELFRANPIEGADTVFLSGVTETSTELRLALTHACDSRSAMEETLFCEKATIHISQRKDIRIVIKDKADETILFSPRQYPDDNLLHFSEYVNGDRDQMLGTLSHCQSFVQLNALAYLSCGEIHHVGPPAAELVENGNYWRIVNIEEIQREFLITGDFSVIGKGGLPCTPHRPVNSPELAGLFATISRLTSSKALSLKS